ncbi:MAG: hypothetical protein AAGA08_16855 [Pseudomonadota bacterium]
MGLIDRIKTPGSEVRARGEENNLRRQFALESEFASRIDGQQRQAEMQERSQVYNMIMDAYGKHPDAQRIATMMAFGDRDKVSELIASNWEAANVGDGVDRVGIDGIIHSNPKDIDPSQASRQGNVQSAFVDENGNLRFLRRDGTVEDTGIKTRNPFQISDVGGVPTAINRQTGQGFAIATPEQVGGNAATIDTIRAQEAARVEAEEELPQLEDESNYMIQTIDALLDHKGFNNRYGMSSIGGFLPAIPGTPAAGAQAYIDQLGGQAFLEAFEALKGGGHITEIEGDKATQAKTRLSNQSISEEEAVKAAGELKGIILRGLQRKRDRAAADPLTDEIAQLEAELGISP